MKSQKDIKRGCGKKIIDKYVKDWYSICGKTEVIEMSGERYFQLCKSCQALLEYNQEVVAMIDEMIYGLKEANAINNVASVLALDKLQLQKAEALKIIITAKRAVLQELKSQIIGEEKEE